MWCGEMPNQRYGAASARVEAGARDEPVTQLLRQRVDLEDLDFAIDHRHVAGMAHPQPNGPTGGQVPAGRAVSVGVAISSASPSQSKDSGTRYDAPSAEAVATQRSTSWVSRCSVSRRR
jgi:hypothetical protein